MPTWVRMPLMAPSMQFVPSDPSVSQVTLAEALEFLPHSIPIERCEEVLFNLGYTIDDFFKITQENPGVNQFAYMNQESKRVRRS